MTKIGFSTGCLYKTKLPLDQRIDFYKEAGTTAIELSFGRFEELENFNLTSSLIKKISEFDYISIHAPFDVKYKKNKQTKEMLKKLLYINQNLPNQGIVIHPDLVKDFSILKNSGLIFLIENMNSEKDKGKSIEGFKEYNKLSFDYVFDTQHTWENDHTTQLAKGLLKIMSSRLKHLHASGQGILHSHWPVHLSENSEEIKEIIKVCPKVPIILEGALLKPDLKLAKKELEFIKSIL